MKISASTMRTTERSVAPSAFMRPNSRLRSMMFALTRFDTPSAADSSESPVMSSMSICVFSRILPSDSAICRTGCAEEPGIASSIWKAMELT